MNAEPLQSLLDLLDLAERNIVAETTRIAAGAVTSLRLYVDGAAFCAVPVRAIAGRMLDGG